MFQWDFLMGSGQKRSNVYIELTEPCLKLVFLVPDRKKHWKLNVSKYLKLKTRESQHVNLMNAQKFKATHTHIFPHRARTCDNTWRPKETRHFTTKVFCPMPTTRRESHVGMDQIPKMDFHTQRCRIIGMTRYDPSPYQSQNFCRSLWHSWQPQKPSG